MSRKPGLAVSGSSSPLPSINSDRHLCVFLRLKTYAASAAAGIPCTVVLDSAVAYVMDKVDSVLVGSEAVVESGGLGLLFFIVNLHHRANIPIFVAPVNAVGSNQMAIIAKAANKPFYALAERFAVINMLCLLVYHVAPSFKFHRLFPLSQYDLPTHNPNVLAFPRAVQRASAL